MEPHYECDLCGNQASHTTYAANIAFYKANKYINNENDDMVKVCGSMLPLSQLQNNQEFKIGLECISIHF